MAVTLMRTPLVAAVFAIALVVAGCTTSGEPVTGDAALAGFYGAWVGGGEARSTDPEAPNEGQRDLGVEIEPYGDDGFTVHWSTSPTTCAASSGSAQGQRPHRRQGEKGRRRIR